MDQKLIKIAVLMCILLVGCKPTSTPVVDSAGPTKGPEPGHYPFYGTISGLPAGTQVEVSNISAKLGKPFGSGYVSPGQYVSYISEAYDEDYIIVAIVPGYVASPASYTVHLKDKKVYLVKNGQITDKEANHIDFSFTPASTP